MGTLEFEKCCYCCSLHAGCLLLGYFGVVLGVLAASLDIARMAGFELLDLHGATIWQTPIHLVAIDFIFELITILIYALFLFGLYKKHPTYVKVVYICIPLQAALYLVAFCFNPIHQNFGDLFCIFIATIIMLYLILCIRSYYLLMLDDEAVRVKKEYLRCRSRSRLVKSVVFVLPCHRL